MRTVVLQFPPNVDESARIPYDVSKKKIYIAATLLNHRKVVTLRAKIRSKKKEEQEQEEGYEQKET